MSTDRILHPRLRERLMSADEAAALIQPGETVAMSGFTGSGYPKAVPQALARRIEQVKAAGTPFQVRVLTGASTAPELDGALAKVDGMALRLPFQSDPEARTRINDGRMEYIDMHLSHVAQQTWFGWNSSATSTSTASASSCARRRSRTTRNWCAASAASR